MLRVTFLLLCLGGNDEAFGLERVWIFCGSSGDAEVVTGREFHLFWSVSVTPMPMLHHVPTLLVSKQSRWSTVTSKEVEVCFIAM